MRLTTVGARVRTVDLALVVLGSAFIVLGNGRAQDRGTTDLYDTSTLQHWQARYRISMNRILTEGFVPVLSADERRAFAGVQLDLPLRDEAFLNFYTEDQTVVLPVAALHWLSEIFIAYAWLALNDYQLEVIEEYVAMLKHKKATDFPGGAYPSPLRALGTPATVSDNARVDELALRLFNSARAFILAHELGHVRYRHQASSLSTEEAADRFALDLMRRTRTIPMGVAFYFQATALWFEGGPPTHPLNAKRLRTLSTRMGSLAGEFGGPGDVDSVRFISRGLEQVADYLDDDEMQRCVAVSVAKASPAVLRPRTRGAPSILSCIPGRQR